jgi:3'-phosphoadenosine 5'-phosphosulfate sulfotransferase (PAPS reductase)/FAD synthetase
MPITPTNNLTADARARIVELLAASERPAVLWSSGQDSQLLLFLIRQIRPNIAVIHLRPLDQGTKHAFADRIIEEWGLRMVPVPLVNVDVVANGNEVNLVEEYALAPGLTVFLPFENEPGRAIDAQSACGIGALKEKQEGLGNPPQESRFDLIFVGHHQGDGDAIFGQLPLVDYSLEVNGVRVAYPLRDFTKADVREASRNLGVLQNDARYLEGDMRANNDYYALCTSCLNPTNTGDMVTCPKINQSVYNLGSVIQPEQRRESWRPKFINIEAR